MTDAAATQLETYRANVSWDPDREDLRAHTITVAQQRFAASSAPERGGDPAKADPEQLLVAAASSCHMLWFLYFCRRERIRVKAYEDEAEGLMDERRFVRIVLRPAVEFDGDTDSEVVVRFHEQAHEACYIANSLNCPVEVEPR